jgi:hypothetical protein
MAYPFAGFGSIFFADDERPLETSDSNWINEPSYARSRALGSAKDNIRTLAIGSAERSFEILMTASRYAAARALINTTATFTDWDRPTPDSRSAKLANVRFVANVGVLCSDGATRRKIRCRWELIEA